MRIAVAGAGALGAAAAFHLARRGHEVILVEREQVAAATTGLAAGLLSLGVEDPLERRLVLASMKGFEENAKSLGEPSPLHRPGSHLLAATDHEAKHLDAVARDLDRLDLEHAVWDRAGWRREMNTRGMEAQCEDLEQVLSIPADAWALSTNATNQLVKAARQQGASLKQSRAVTGILWDDDRRARGLRLSDDTTLPADRVVLALGAWTRGFLEREQLRLPALAFTTHAGVLSLPSKARPPILHDHGGHYYLRPEGDAHILVGDGTDTDPTDPQAFHSNADPGFVHDVARRLTERFPALGQARLVNAWRGLLTGTPDRAALVGEHPDAEGLFVVTGGNGYGFMRSWALGAILGACVDEEDHVGDDVPSEAIAHTALSRFWPDPPSGFPIREGFELPSP